MYSKKSSVGCWIFAMIILSGVSFITQAQSQVDAAALKNWQDLRFGMFIHWGPVSLKGTEIGWSRKGPRPDRDGTGEIPAQEYDNLYKQFNPTRFDAGEWVNIAKAAGMKYIVIVAKHHDGFCMFDSKLTDYKITNSPFKRDVCAELAKACHDAGIRLGFYYSPPDWHHPDFFTADHARYIDYLHGQVRELLTNYGQVDILWFDMEGGKNTAETWGNAAMFPMIRKLQPQILLTKRCGGWGDFDTPEQRVGGFNRNCPWETCMTICNQWAWKPDDTMKSETQCIQTLLATIGGDGNFLFNVGPMPDGQIEPRQVERLKEMGRWIGKHADAIYGTRGGPYKPGKWGASTCKENKIFLFIMNWPKEGTLKMPELPAKITKAEVRGGGSMTFHQTPQSLELDVTPQNQDSIATAIELTLDSQAFSIQPIVFPSGSVAFGKKADASNVNNKNKACGPDNAFDDDTETRWATDDGVKTSWIQVDLGSEKTVNQAMINESEWDRVKEFQLQYQVGTEWKTAYAGKTIGATKEITFKPVTARIFRLNIIESEEGVTISEIQLFQADQKQN